MANYKRWTLTYVVSYLTIGGLGFAFFPQQTLDLFQSNGDYDSVGFRLAGMMMVGLAYLIFSIVRREDWKYYPVSIVVRSAFVLFMFWLYAVDQDPLFLVINAIVLFGLVPSIVLYLRHGNGGAANQR